MSRCREIGRSMVDWTRRGAATRRASAELLLAACRLIVHPRYRGRIGLVTGDLDPRVLLPNLRYFFVPVATWEPRRVDLGPGHPLRPRYRDHPTTPFLVLTRDVGRAARARWADIEGALELEDEQALPRLAALRQLSSARQPSCLPPRPPAPMAWQARELGPGEEVDRAGIVWVRRGWLRALAPCPGGASHLASMGPDVVYAPHPGLEATVARLRAVTEAQVLLGRSEDQGDCGSAQLLEVA